MFFFLGQHTRSLDSKGRSAIPPAYREAFKDGLVITRGKKDYLIIFPLEKWHALANRFEDLPVYTQDRPADLRRLVFAHAVSTTLDSHGRIRIPIICAPLFKSTARCFLRALATTLKCGLPTSGNKSCKNWRPFPLTTNKKICCASESKSQQGVEAADKVSALRFFG